MESSPKATEILNLCKKTIEVLAQWHSSLPTACSENYLMNKQQWAYLVKKLSEKVSVLQDFQQSKTLDETVDLLALQELQKVLFHAESMIKASYITTTSQLLRAAIEQGDMKETLSELLYDIEWHTRVLRSIIPVDNFGKFHMTTFESEMCNVQLDSEDESYLQKAKKEDEKSLKDCLESLKLDNVELDDAAEIEHAKQLLTQTIAVEDIKPSSSSAVGGNREEAEELSTEIVEDSHGLVTTSCFNMLVLNPQDPKSYFKKGLHIGRGTFGEVLKTNILGGEYAVKIISCRLVGKEIPPALKLGRQPPYSAFLVLL